MKLNNLTLRARIKTMSDSELRQLAAGEALAMADSSRMEGLVLDEHRIKEELLAGYLEIRALPE